MTTKKVEFEVDVTPDLTMAQLVAVAEAKHPSLQVKDVLHMGAVVTDRCDVHPVCMMRPLPPITCCAASIAAAFCTTAVSAQLPA